ncbi:HPP family protein [Jeotgalibacillus sp. R-1-5s-1]|uniref:CBS domain-containing protein n=1 Tax=Jeotgalibacillus sp. R-1-5s-1 TaxID=2555897 RepID=UPI00106AEFB8|nr:CBS domain-containing protein [Jeotgalibacillus sp. R-1-5s-1]TFE00434.1 CBS domain-containing protein [Jeotgalibacillus sp. R-1-5s-1]
MFTKSAMVPAAKSFTVQVDDSVKKVIDLLEEKEIDALPVLEGVYYRGVVTRYHIYKAFFESALSKDDFYQNTTAGDVLTHENTYLKGDEIFETTLYELNDFPLISVADENKVFKGIVTRYDVFNQFQSAFGMHKKGVRIAFTSVETEGRISRLAELIQQFHESVISLVTFDETDKLVRRIVLKLEKKDNIDKFIQKLEKSGFRVLDIKEDD